MNQTPEASVNTVLTLPTDQLQAAVDFEQNLKEASRLHRYHFNSGVMPLHNKTRKLFTDAIRKQKDGVCVVMLPFDRLDQIGDEIANYVGICASLADRHATHPLPSALCAALIPLEGGLISLHEAITNQEY